MFNVGQTYSRQEISNAVGGSVVSYLPRRKGLVTCGCFRLDLNPGAPEEVTINRLERAEPRMLSKQAEPIPIFVRRSSGTWEYRGHYRCVRLSTEPTLLQKKNEQNPTRAKGRVRGVLYFERVSD